MKKQLRIGIDPDLDKSGYCLIESEPFGKQRITVLSTLPFWELIETIEKVNRFITTDETLMIFIEAGWLNKVSNYHGAVNKSVAGRIGKNVGENHAVGKLLEQYCKACNIPYKLVKPESKKWDAELFKKITGWKNRTNQEHRDAVRTAWR